MSSIKENNKVDFALEKNNYVLMGIGLAVIILGFILMAGGRSNDPKVFNESMFNFQRITLAPLLVFGGFVFEIYAILKKPKSN
jgi:membrane-bound ClpP family serine protease